MMKNKGKVRVQIPKSEEYMIGCDGCKTTTYLKETPYPYTSDGFIDRKGRFFAVIPWQHDGWARHYFGVTEHYLTAYAGWVVVWSYDMNMRFRWETKVFSKISNEQKKTIVDWCEGQKVDLNKSLGSFRFMFEQ